MIFELLFFYVFNSWKNRLMVRLKRLRQPKYLLGGIAGGLYVYFAFLRQMFAGSGVRTSSIPLEYHGLAVSIASALLMLFIFAAWVVPHDRAALTFSEAEVAFLFPAPISRRTLIHFKLCKAQLSILFSALIFSLIGRSIGGGTFPVRVLGWWVMLSTINLHLLGSSFAMTKLMDRGISSWRRRTIILSGATVALITILAWGWNTFPAAQLEDIKNFATIATYLRHVLESGPLPYVLYPFRIVVSPYLAANFHEGLAVLPAALGVMVVHYFWVVRSNVAFEEASIDASRKMAERIAAARSGNWHNAQRKAKARRNPFNLKPVGMPALALLWKNLISAGSFFTSRVWIFVLIYLVCFSLAVGGAATNRHGLRMLVTMVACFFAVFSMIMGPQVLRQDLRQDLLMTDMLKLYPMSGWQVVFGEILTPVTILTSVQWLLIVVAGLFCPPRLADFDFTVPFRIGVCLSAAILLPFLNLVALTIPNTAVLIFPAWFQFSKDTARGLETMGQQMILLFGQMMILILGLVPAAGLAAGIFLLVNFVAGMVPAMVGAAVGAAVILGLEAVVGLVFLGRRFDRFDLSAELSERA